MKLENGQKNIEIRIDSYEFPYDKEGQKEDNNWLNVHMICEDDVIQEGKIVPCLLTWELNKLIESLEALCTGNMTSYTSDFIEPNLEVRLQPYEEQIACCIRFLFPNQNEPFVFVKKMTMKELYKFIEDIKKQSEAYPIR